MITAALSAAIVAALAFLGITLSAAQIAGLVVVVKILVTVTILLIGLVVAKRRKAAAAASGAPPPGPDHRAPGQSA
jgi:amino acid transporter